MRQDPRGKCIRERSVVAWLHHVTVALWHAAPQTLIDLHFVFLFIFCFPLEICKQLMLRRALHLLAEAPAGGAAGGGGGGNTILANGRVIAVKKKAKWIDRRSKGIPHNGKDAYHPSDQPSCELCHVRFRFKQDQQAHKDSELHQNRLRWVETQRWWAETGEPAHLQKHSEDWKWFEETVLPTKAAEEGITVAEARQRYRRAIMPEDPKYHMPLQPPTVRAEIKEPKDQRWPSSPKW